MNKNLFEGPLIRLIPMDVERDAAKMAAWGRDSEYQRLLDMSPAVRFNAKLVQNWYEKAENGGHSFMIQTLVDDLIIGFIELDGFDWAAGTAWVGIGVGEREYRGKGFGTDAMKVLLHYAFTEMNLHRVNLNVFDFNRRAVRSYEKAGFKYEGTERERIFKEDQRWDVIDMGILKSDWELMQEEQPVSIQTPIEVNA